MEGLSSILKNGCHPWEKTDSWEKATEAAPGEALGMLCMAACVLPFLPRRALLLCFVRVSALGLPACLAFEWRT